MRKGPFTEEDARLFYTRVDQGEIWGSWPDKNNDWSKNPRIRVNIDQRNNKLLRSDWSPLDTGDY